MTNISDLIIGLLWYGNGSFREMAIENKIWFFYIFLLSNSNNFFKLSSLYRELILPKIYILQYAEQPVF